MSPKPIFILDWATCNNYVLWFYECDDSDDQRRTHLMDLQCASASQKANSQNPLMIIAEDMADNLSKQYPERDMVVDSFLEAAEIKSFVLPMPIMDQIVRLAGIYSLTKRPVYIVASDPFLSAELKKQNGLKVINLDEVGPILASHGVTGSS